MLVNGVEKLTCITSIRSVTHAGGLIRVEPLRNFPVVSDLVVDMSRLYSNLGEAGFFQVAELDNACLPFEKAAVHKDEKHERLVDCIECGLCISACPVALTTPTYLGPAVLAAIQHGHEDHEKVIRSLDFGDSENGVWRCHSGFECSIVCPSNVDPAWRIMDLRKRIIGHRLKKLFGKS
jgi:succinate dehydrogenase / fumarate reductase iron-sulfur subunit